MFISKHAALLLLRVLLAITRVPRVPRTYCLLFKGSKTGWPHPNCWFHLPNCLLVPAPKLSAASSSQTEQRSYSTNVQLTQVKSIAGIFLAIGQYTYICSNQLWSESYLLRFQVKSHIFSLPHSCTEGKAPEISSLIFQDRLQQRPCNSLTKSFKCFISLFFSFFPRSFVS